MWWPKKSRCNFITTVWRQRDSVTDICFLGSRILDEERSLPRIPGAYSDYLIRDYLYDQYFEVHSVFIALEINSGIPFSNRSLLLYFDKWVFLLTHLGIYGIKLTDTGIGAQYGWTWDMLPWDKQSRTRPRRTRRVYLFESSPQGDASTVTRWFVLRF